MRWGARTTWFATVRLGSEMGRVCMPNHRAFTGASTGSFSSSSCMKPWALGCAHLSLAASGVFVLSPMFCNANFHVAFCGPTACLEESRGIPRMPVRGRWLEQIRLPARGPRRFSGASFFFSEDSAEKRTDLKSTAVWHAVWGQFGLNMHRSHCYQCIYPPPQRRSEHDEGSRDLAWLPK